MVESKKNIKQLFRTPPSFRNRIGRVVRLDRNERTTPFPEKHFKKILESISVEEIVAYPELETFYKKLSKWLGVNRNEVLLVSGSDTGIRAVYEVYVEEGDEVIMFPPTYGMYSVYCSMFGGVKKELCYNDDFSLPIERVLSAISNKTKLLAIVNPNHTGTAFSESELIQITKSAMNKNAIVLVDEAYYHFHNHTMIKYINEFDNLIIVRTFSKAFGIAPLRIGYLIANSEIIAQLYKVKLTHEITSISAKFGEYLLDHLEIMNNYVKEVKEGIKYLTKEFSQLGIFVPKTYTNFIFAKLPNCLSAKLIVESLKEKRIYINGPFTVVPINGFIRITAGPKSQMQDFISIFKPILKKALKIKKSL